jgi:hypothetical protein
MKIRFLVSIEGVREEYSDYMNTDCIIEWEYPFLPRTGEFLAPQAFELVISKEMKRIFQSLKSKDFFETNYFSTENGAKDFSVLDEYANSNNILTIQNLEWGIDDDGLPMPTIWLTD